MQKDNFFKEIYDDFFGIEKLKTENKKLANELGISVDTEVPSIQMKDITSSDKNTDNASDNKITNQVVNEKSQMNKDEIMKTLFEKVEDLYIDDKSKNILKKIIEYMRKYNEKIEKVYIPFNMIVYSNNDEELHKIADVITKSANTFNYVKIGNTAEVSLYNLEKVEQLNELYNEKNSIILMKDIDFVLKQDKIFKDKLIHFIETTIKKNERKYITLLNFDNERISNDFFEDENDLKQNLFQFEISIIKPDIQDVYQEVLDKLNKNYILEEDFSVALLEYIEVTYINTNLSFPEYRDKLLNYILFNKDEKITKQSLPVYEKDKSLDEVFSELNELVGLHKVKQVLHELVDLIELKNKTQGDLKIKDTNLHMIFLGNPGTGKTTVARHVAEILYNLKYIKQNKLMRLVVSC